MFFNCYFADGDMPCVKNGPRFGVIPCGRRMPVD